MAQKAGDRLNIAQKAVRWMLTKAAAGVGLSLTDPKGWTPMMGGSSSSGKPVNDETAMQLSAVWACVRILSSSVGVLPIAVYERQKNGNAEKVEHPLAEILTDTPNADMTPVEFFEADQTNLGLQGNGYNYLERRGDGNVASLYPIPANNCIPYRDRDTLEITFKVLERGKWVIYPREKIWHLKGFGSNGLVGFTPIGMMRNAIGLGLASEEFGAKVFMNGGYPSLVVKIPQWLKEDQREIARKNIRDMWSGMTNNAQVQLLEGGMEIDKGGSLMPPEDMQLLELRQFQVQEICRLYGIPPHMVAEMAKGASYASIEQMSREYVDYGLMPWLRRWEASANRWLLKPGDRGRFFVRFNPEAMLRGDTAARAEFYSKMLQNGVYNRNEVRGKENMNSVDGLDDYTVQSNMTPVDMLAGLIAAQSQNKAPATVVKAGDVHLHSTVNTPEVKAEFHAGDTRVDVKPGETVVNHKGGDVTLAPSFNVDANKGPVRSETTFKRDEHGELVKSTTVTESK